MTTTLGILGLPGGPEWIVILIIGILIFGKRLPEVGRSLGRGIVEFKKGVKGVEDQIENELDKPANESGSGRLNNHEDAVRQLKNESEFSAPAKSETPAEANVEKPEST